MKQHDAQWPALLETQGTEDRTLLKQIALILGLGMLGIILLISLIYLPFTVAKSPMSVDPATAVSVEQTLGAEYILQTAFLSGRFVIPLAICLLAAAGILVYVLRTKAQKA